MCSSGFWSFAYGVESGVIKNPKIEIQVAIKIRINPNMANLLRLNRCHVCADKDSEL